MQETAAPSPIQRLGENRERLRSLFLEGKEPAFFQRYAESIDDYFREAFSSSLVGPDLRVDKNPYAIVALGGYGRKEQHLFSDVDVLLLFKKRIPEKAKELVQEILYPLWDIGLEVGHGTRSIKESTSLASQDFEVLTSLLDSRFVCGISSLYTELMEKLRKKVFPKRGKAYVRWLSERNRVRHNRFGDSTYLLEPNLKEGLGGLRDYHTMLWAGRALYNIRSPRDFEFQGHLPHEEYRNFTKALSFIRTVRNWLHHLTRRKCDQLYFEHQIRLASALGFQDNNGQQAVETFLGVLHKQMQFVKRQHLIFLDKALKTRKKRRVKGSRRSLSTGIVLENDALHFESPEAVVKNPRLLIRIFEKSALLKKPLCDQATRLVQEFRYLIDGHLRASGPVIKSFKRIVSTSGHDFNVLGEMLSTGMMVKLIPEMKEIVDRIQYDEYHLYPVDKHCIRTVQVLKELRDADSDSPNAFYAGLFREISNPDILLWSGLLHDVGKGVTQEDLDDHEERGARIAEQVCTRMQFTWKETETIANLVREHLSLIHIATRRDINDERNIVQCARRFGDDEHLKMLYLLTVADCMATGPKAWNDWKEALLKELFFKIYHVLKEGDLGSQASAKIVEKKKRDVFNAMSFLPEEERQTLFDHLSPRYLLYTPVEDILNHLQLFLSLESKPSALKANIDTETDFRTITICAKDFPGLFSKIAGVFTLHGLNILSAHIYTWRNRIALDIFEVETPPDTLREAEKWERVDTDLKAVLGGTLSLSNALEKRLTAETAGWKVSSEEDRVVVDNRTSHFFSVIDVGFESGRFAF